ncbi:alpha-methylacyl-CoA racemase [Sphingopyxis sp. OAS728]|uniref:CaiB/BaiF CoA transferase family protein n=1 Tax=Sphingopyxis sp. OAS728 TaxID=2663823 RepID=UPI0019E388CF|nr:CaiB/BaiF CoA-transferase family protein [Sphingopyxis sp. OAS728]MBE1527141.1 alpha-methylacyl-CoA racemase [Sphingopyxis sp. OAS728]
MNCTDRIDSGLMRPVLDGVRVIELAGIGPAPFCGMMLADHGAEVIRIDRPGGSDPLSQDQGRDVLLRSRRSITLDLKRPEAVEIVARLVETADGLIEGFRPGVAERLGLGPAVLMERNPALVYGRMTGWGQDGPLADKAGHDLNYISISGCLAALGCEGEPPMPPLNLIGDYGGGGMLLAFGFVSALLAARQSGAGRVIDCSMADGAAALMAGMWSLRHNGMWDRGRGQNLLDGGAPFYACYACADGRFVAIGAIEAQFYARLVDALGLGGDPLFAAQHDQSRWPAMKARLAAIFAGEPRATWTARLQSRDCCYSEVLTMADATAHEHSRARGSYVEAGGWMQPRPAPRFADTDVVMPKMWQRDSDRAAILAEIGAMDPDRVTAG